MLHQECKTGCRTAVSCGAGLDQASGDQSQPSTRAVAAPTTAVAALVLSLHSHVRRTRRTPFRPSPPSWPSRVPRALFSTLLPPLAPPPLLLLPVLPPPPSQRPLIRLALEGQLEELLALEAVLPEKATLAQDEKDAAVAKARQRGALRNPLARYAGKVGLSVCLSACLGMHCVVLFSFLLVCRLFCVFRSWFFFVVFFVLFFVV